MKKAARRVYNVLRTIVVTIFITVVTLFVGLYVALSIPSVQDYIKGIGEKELSNLLHTKVTIGAVSIMPFNEVVLKDVQVPDQKGDSLFCIEKLGAGISLYNLIKNQRFVFTYAEIIGLRGRITKPDKDSPTNMQFIIDAFKPKDNKPPKPFDLKIFNIVLFSCNIFTGAVSYVLSPLKLYTPLNLSLQYSKPLYTISCNPDIPEALTSYIFSYICLLALNAVSYSITIGSFPICNF